MSATMWSWVVSRGESVPGGQRDEGRPRGLDGRGECPCTSLDMHRCTSISD